MAIDPKSDDDEENDLLFSFSRRRVHQRTISGDRSVQSKGCT
jgi:hypothetical protein